MPRVAKRKTDDGNGHTDLRAPRFPSLDTPPEQLTELPKKKAKAIKEPAPKSLAIDIKPINLWAFTVEVEGLTSLICNRWSEKARNAMLADQQRTEGATKKKREPKNLDNDFEGSLYKLPNGKYGFPSVAFKAACIKAAKIYCEKGVAGRIMSAVHIFGPNRQELVIVEGKPEQRVDMVRVGPWSNRVADIRARGEFMQWKATLHVRVDIDLLKPDVVINLINRAGNYSGVGEWRVEKSGMHGMFRVVNVSTPNEERAGFPSSYSSKEEIAG